MIDKAKVTKVSNMLLHIIHEEELTQPEMVAVIGVLSLGLSDKDRAYLKTRGIPDNKNDLRNGGLNSGS